MDSAQHSFDNYSLHQAAVRGDHEGVRRAIHSGADVNALDNTGRTVVACAVAGDKCVSIVTTSEGSLCFSRQFQLGEYRRV
jgi:hypothetical protein